MQTLPKLLQERSLAADFELAAQFLDNLIKNPRQYLEAAPFDASKLSIEKDFSTEPSPALRELIATYQKEVFEQWNNWSEENITLVNQYHAEKALFMK